MRSLVCIGLSLALVACKAPVKQEDSQTSAVPVAIPFILSGLQVLDYVLIGSFGGLSIAGVRMQGYASKEIVASAGERAVLAEIERDAKAVQDAMRKRFTITVPMKNGSKSLQSRKTSEDLVYAMSMSNDEKVKHVSEMPRIKTMASLRRFKKGGCVIATTKSHSIGRNFKGYGRFSSEFDGIAAASSATTKAYWKCGVAAHSVDPHVREAMNDLLFKDNLPSLPTPEEFPLPEYFEYAYDSVKLFQAYRHACSFPPTFEVIPFARLDGWTGAVMNEKDCR